MLPTASSSLRHGILPCASHRPYFATTLPLPCVFHCLALPTPFLAKTPHSPFAFNRLVLQPCFFAKTPPLCGLQEHRHVHFWSTEPLPVPGSLRHATKEMINPVLSTYMSSLWLGQGGALGDANLSNLPTSHLFGCALRVYRADACTWRRALVRSPRDFNSVHEAPDRASSLLSSPPLPCRPSPPSSILFTLPTSILSHLSSPPLSPLPSRQSKPLLMRI